MMKSEKVIRDTLENQKNIIEGSYPEHMKEIAKWWKIVLVWVLHEPSGGK